MCCVQLRTRAPIITGQAGNLWPSQSRVACATRIHETQRRGNGGTRHVEGRTLMDESKSSGSAVKHPRRCVRDIGPEKSGGTSMCVYERVFKLRPSNIILNTTAFHPTAMESTKIPKFPSCRRHQSLHILAHTPMPTTTCCFPPGSRRAKELESPPGIPLFKSEIAVLPCT